MPECGVYCFTLRGTKRCYVGSSKNIQKRRNRHLTMARAGSELRFHKALREFGAEAFDFEVLALCDQERLHEVEDLFFLLKESTRAEGFNVRTRAAGGYDPKEVSEATRERLRVAGTGRPVSAETREKLRAMFKGRKMSAESRTKMSASAKARAGTASAESRAKMGAHSRGKPRSAEVCAKISAAHKGKRCPEERRARISAALTGRKASEETLAKRSSALKASWAKRREAKKTSLPTTPLDTLGEA
jgi:group I intron endonuclease